VDQTVAPLEYENAIRQFHGEMRIESEKSGPHPGQKPAYRQGRGAGPSGVKGDERHLASLE
jgi:hypothetical protein